MGSRRTRQCHIAIRTARDHINLETCEELGRHDLLIERQPQDVQINVIYDTARSLSTPESKGPLLSGRHYFPASVAAASCTTVSSTQWCWGPEFGAEMEALFNTDLAESTRIELVPSNRRSLPSRMREITARIWEYWL